MFKEEIINDKCKYARIKKILKFNWPEKLKLVWKHPRVVLTVQIMIPEGEGWATM